MKHKSGFTLVELMILFLILTLLLAASAPLITKRYKNIPSRINHGKYLCYRDSSNRLVEEYYNSTSRVSQKFVSQCSFKPPKTAALFKIELIGAGAGGYYEGYATDETTMRTGQWDMLNGLSGSAYAEPSDSELQRMFKGQEVVLAKYTGGAGSGGNVNYRYFPPANAICRINTELGNYYSYPSSTSMGYSRTVNGIQYLFNYSAVSSRMQNMSNAINRVSNLSSSSSSPRTYIPSMHSSLESFCKDYVLISQADEQAGKSALIKFNEKSGTASGAYGGSGKYLKFVFNIDFTGIPLTSTKSYLKSLLNTYYLTGTCSTEACMDGSFVKGGTIATTATRGKDYSLELSELDESIYDTDIPSHEDTTSYNGTDVQKYAAIKVKDGSYVTNSKRATGGEGAQINISGSTGRITHSSPSRGENADGVSLSNPSSYEAKKVTIQSGSVSSSRPVLKIETTLNIRKHFIGQAGGAGKYKTVYASDLGSGCTFTIPAGGDYVDELSEEITSSDLAAKMVCKDGAYTLQADGGTYNRSVALAKTINTFSSVSVSDYKTSAPQGEASPFMQKNSFTQYSIPNINPGAGGSGTGIIDKCTQPWGGYKYTIGGKTENNIIPNTCDINSEENIVKVAPGKGSGGAVLISW